MDTLINATISNNNMTTKQTATLNRYIALYVSELEKTHDVHLDPADRLLLVDFLVSEIPRRATKFILGAKAHPIPLIDRVCMSDIEEELIDASFYAAAYRKRQQRSL